MAETFVHTELVQVALQQQHDRIIALRDRLDRAYSIIFGLRDRLDTEPYVEDRQIKYGLDQALKVLVGGAALASGYTRHPVTLDRPAAPDERAG